MAGEINLRITQLKQNLDPIKMAKAAYKVFYRYTPVKTGNARRNTTVNQNEINAHYPYAQRLDNGYSKQSPTGMTKPTMAWLQSYVKQVPSSKNTGK